MKSLDKLREWSRWLDNTYATDDGKCYNVYNYQPYDGMKSCGEYMREQCDEIEEEFALYSLRNYPKPFGSPEAMHMVLGTAADNFDTPEEAVDYMSGETSMPLPVDADGVPIRPGDKLIAYNERFDVEGIGDGTVIFRAEDDELGELFNPAATIHVKPDTLKELLDDVSKGIICYPRERVTGYLEDNHSVGEAVMLDVRDRLRELLGGDAE